MSTEPNIDNDAKSSAHTGIMNWPSAIMLCLWLLVIFAFSGISAFELLGSPYVLGIILAAAFCVTGWSALRFFKTRDKNP